MIDTIATVLKETTKKNINDMFKELNKQMTPNELLLKGKKYKIFANPEEITNIRLEILYIRKVNRYLPRTGGEWDGEEGNSIWKPNKNEIPKKPPGNTKTWGEILEKYGIEGIKFKDGEPDFSVVSEGTVEIEDFTEDRNANFTQADEKLAEQWTKEGKDGKEWSPQDVKEYRKENNLSWHERSDKKTMDLVPQEIHGNIPHSGGISATKNKNS